MSPLIDAAVSGEYLQKMYAGTIHQWELRRWRTSKGRTKDRIEGRLFTRQLAEVEQFVKGSEGLNVAVGAATRANHDGTKAGCREIPAVWCDLDFSTSSPAEVWGRIRNFQFPPTVVVGSGGGLHPYWKFRSPQPANAKVIEPLLRGVTLVLGGDMECAEIAHVMRLPGTANFKYDPPRPCVIAEANWNLRYSPEDFARFVTASQESKQQAKQQARQKTTTGGAAKVHEPNRHNTLLALARSLRQQGMSRDDILAMLRVFNQERCEPPKSDDELQKIVDWVMGNVASAGGLGNVGSGEWPDPLPLGGELPPVALLELDMLPESLREWVSDVAERMQVPLAFPAASMVVSLAGCVSRRVRIQPKEIDSSWIVTPNLWGDIIGPPGVMKSPIIEAIVSPMERIEAEWRKEYETELKKYKDEVEKHELKVAVWKESFKRAAKRSPPGEPEAKPELEAEEPTEPRLLLNDATFEAVHELLAKNRWGLLHLRDELTGWLATLGRQGREGERAFFLEGWNGNRPFTVDRIGRGSIYVPACCLSLFGGIQPARLRAYLVDALRDGPSNDGLIQRFSVTVWPDIPPDWELVDRLPNLKAQARVARVFFRLVSLRGEPGPILKFDAQAQELFNEWWTELERELRSGELHPAMAAHLSKYKKLVPALALIFELADWAASEEELPLPQTVTLAHTRQGVAFANDFLRSHAERMYSSITTPEIRAAIELGEKLAGGKLPETFSLRDVYLKGWTGLGTPGEVRAALELLADAHWVRALPPEPSTGGRPPERFQVNSKVRLNGSTDS
jgi:putative DNA primase/helicase